MNHIVVLGGSFDPVHSGHIAMADAARLAFPDGVIYWVPAGHAPHKLDQTPASASDRVCWLQLVLHNRDHEQLCQLEVNRPGPSFMVDTLLALKKDHPAARLTLLLGADSLEHLLSWSRLDQLFSLADFLFVPRPGFGATTLSRFRKGLDSATKHSFQANMLDMPEVDVSSTLIRERLANGQSIDGYLPVTVAKAIKSARAYTKP